MAMTRYTVTAERGSGPRPPWVFQCIEHPGAISESKRLDQAEMLMREAIAWVAGVPEDEVEIDLRTKVDDSVDALLQRARDHRQHAEDLASQATGEFRKAVQEMASEGMTVRDIGTVIGVSYQRAHQLVNS